MSTARSQNAIARTPSATMTDKPNMGRKVTVREGYGYYLENPAAFHRSDGTITGTEYATLAGTVYFRLPADSTYPKGRPGHTSLLCVTFG